MDMQVNPSGQHRGFRRRCLDFDTSVARGKNLDTGRRSLRRRQSIAEVSPSVTSASAVVSCERASAAVDATMSGFSMSMSDLLNAKECSQAMFNSSAPATGIFALLRVVLLMLLPDVPHVGWMFKLLLVNSFVSILASAQYLGFYWFCRHMIIGKMYSNQWSFQWCRNSGPWLQW